MVMLLDILGRILIVGTGLFLDCIACFGDFYLPIFLDSPWEVLSFLRSGWGWRVWGEYRGARGEEGVKTGIGI